MADSKTVVISECLLDIDPFGKPAVLNNEEAIALLITRIILMEAGTNPLMPGMGCSLVSKYRYSFPADDSDIKEDIKDQLETYLPSHQTNDINFVYNDDKTVNIEIDIDDIKYVYDSAEIVPLTLEDMKDEE